jgi:hypothetical protein
MADAAAGLRQRFCAPFLAETILGTLYSKVFAAPCFLLFTLTHPALRLLELHMTRPVRWVEEVRPFRPVRIRMRKRSRKILAVWSKDRPRRESRKR